MTRNQRWIAVLLGAFLVADADATALINDKKVQIVLTGVTKGASLKSPPRDSGSSRRSDADTLGGTLMRSSLIRWLSSSMGFLLAAFVVAQAPAKKPNILVIMGDDVGWFNIGAYHQGIMSGKTPNLDKLAAEGMRFTDYYAEASCTAGRANLITGELPIRTG